MFVATLNVIRRLAARLNRSRSRIAAYNRRLEAWFAEKERRQWREVRRSSASLRESWAELVFLLRVLISRLF